MPNAPTVVFRGTLGLNNAVDPVRLIPGQESGFSFLAAAYNVDIDKSGRVTRRKGFTITQRTESSYSIFSDGVDCLFISGTSLYRLRPDYSRVGLRSGLTENARMSFCKVGDRIFYCNGYENGVVIGDTSYAWTKGTYVGPETIRVFSNPPIGRLLEVWNGRIFISQDKVIWYSEPFSYDFFDLANCHISFSSSMRFISAVDDGLYIGTSDGVYFLGGEQPEKVSQRKVASSPAIEGTVCKVTGTAIRSDLTGIIIICTLQDGIYMGMRGGDFINITKERLVYPTVSRGCALVKDKRYICLLEE
jgi:hypothetical protein